MRRKFSYFAFQLANTKALIRLYSCAGWSAPLVFANNKRLVNYMDAQNKMGLSRLQKWAVWSVLLL